MENGNDIRKVLGRLVSRARGLVNEARNFGWITKDVAVYARQRIQQQYRTMAVAAGEDPVGALLDQVILSAEDRLVGMKSSVALCIIDEKRLALVVEQSAAAAEEWESRASAAELQGDATRASESRARAASHADQTQRYRGQLEQQQAELRCLKDMLRRLHMMIEEAKQARGRIAVHRRRVRAHQELQADLRRMSMTVRMLEELVTLDGAGNDDEHSDSRLAHVSSKNE